eukprot:78098-Prorocentrum_lima.AAC.1
MTSSLVGSEMCIRDRLKRWEDLDCFRRLPRSKSTNRVDGTWVLKWKTVSYTHLTLPTICSV